MQRLFKIYLDGFRGLSMASWMLSIVMLINRTGSMVLPFLGVYMSDHLKFELDTVGIVLSCFGIGAVVGSWLGGRLTDKWGEYYVQLWSLWLSVPLFCLYPFCKDPLLLGLLVFAQSVISELFRPANSVAITKYASPQNLTRSFSLNRMAVNLGFSFGPAMGGLLALISYDFLFYSNALAALLAGWMYLVFFRKRQRLYTIRKIRAERYMPKQIIDEAANISPYKDIPFVVFCLICTLFSISFFQLMNTLPLFYDKKMGLNQAYIGILMGVNGFVVVLFEMLLVQLSERFLQLRYTMLIGTLFCALSFGLLIFEPVFGILVLAMALLSIGEILILPFMATITANRSGPLRKGAYMGMNGMAFSIAFILAPSLGTKYALQYGFSNLWILTTILLIICSMAFFYFVPYLSRNK